MKFKFDFCHEKEWLKPRKLLTDRDQGDVLCYILKVHLNVHIVQQGYRPVYSGDTDQLIKEEIQQVQSIRPPDVQNHEDNFYARIMRDLFHIHQSCDVSGPFCTWIVVVPGRYFYIRYAKYGNGEYVKLPVQWLERHIDNGDKNKRSGGFIHEFITENFYTYRMNICNVYFNSILDLSVFDNTTHVDTSRRNIDISVEENITIAPIADADISTANTKSPIQSPIEDETANKKGIPILNGINLDLSEEVEFEMLEQEVELQDVQQLDTAQGVLGIMTTRPLGLPEAFRGSAPDVPAGIQTLRAVSNNPRVVDLCCKFCRPTT